MSAICLTYLKKNALITKEKLLKSLASKAAIDIKANMENLSDFD